ncbi:small-conductance mechanosensitive channel [Spirosoma lacussanchae]|uniref:hypothetical protein n=1 Tax=Spirosoma lacussanchae TaxID=1884249 RepID=UPI00110804C9|nr:hypothetical protein [Spirosoma lacussanchae]
MNKLSRTQLDQITQQLQRTGPHLALEAELLDHIASLIEQRMDQGQTFTVASEQVMQQANSQVIAQLKQVYHQELGPKHSLGMPKTSRARFRMKRRPTTRPFQFMQLSSILTFLLLIGFLLVVSRPLAIPMAAFRTAWGAAGLAGILLLGGWLTNKLRKSKRPLTA